MPSFSISESLGFGWRTFREHSGLTLAATLLLLIIDLVVRFFAVAQTPSVAEGSAVFFGFCLEVIIGIGFTIIILKLARGESARFRDIIPPGRLFWQSLVTGIGLVLLMFVSIAVGTFFGLGIALIAGGSKGAVEVFVTVGFVIGCIAMMWVAVRYFFLRLVAVDGVRRMGEIFHRSAMLSAGVRWRLLWFIIVMGLINLLGAIILVGLLVSVPVTYLAFADVYLKLEARAPALAHT